MQVYSRALLIAAVFALSHNAWAQTRTPQVTQKKNVQSDPYSVKITESKLKTNMENDAKEHIRLEVGQTKLVHISEKVIRVSVAEPTVADIQVVTNTQVLITAKAVGYTHLILWSSRDTPLVIAVSVTRNLDQLRSQFAELFPDEEITVSSVGDLIVLSGTVSDLRLPARAAEVASLYTERLANLIQVTGDQQVQLDVRFAEVSRSGMRKAGLNFLWRDTQRGYVGGISADTTQAGQYLNKSNAQIPGTGYIPGPPSVPAPPAGDAFNLFFSTGLSDFPFSTILSILSQEGLAKVLAEPTLVALSGQEAEFHAGGELPILVAQQLGNVSIRFKKFGVRLKFTPTVLGEKSLSLKLGVEVSEPDASVGVMVTGFQVPGFKTRSSETTIRLRDGQSFAIAGLLSDSVRATVAKVPLLGDIPILGMLFRSTAYQRDETELLMVVTGHLVRPLQPDEVPFMPGEDEFNDPNDLALFLLGSISPNKTEKAKQKEEEERRNKQLRQSPVKSTTSEAAPKNAPKAVKAQAAHRGTWTAKRDETLDLHQGPMGPIGFIRD